MHYSISTPDSLLEIHMEDGITKAAVLSFWKEIERHPKYQDVVGILLIFGRQMQWHTSTKEIQELARESARLREVPWAIVAHDPLSFGMTRMFALQAPDEGRFSVFRNEAAAREWLKTFLSPR